MSTRMYCYRVAKDELWPLVETVRAYYDANSSLGLIKHALIRAPLDQSEKVHDQLYDAERLNGNEGSELECELQLFDAGETWLIRPLERGWLFANSFEEQEWPVEPVFYDDGSDVPSKNEPNRAVAVWMDEQIKAHRFCCIS
jgi:hypothetical protein